SAEVQDRSAHLQEQGLGAFRRGDLDAADDLFRRALDLTPSSPSIYNNIGVTFARRLDIAEAACWLEKAFSLAPLDPTVGGNLGVIRWLQGRFEESYRLLEASIVRGYSSAGACYAMGIMSLQKGRPANAIKHLSRVRHGDYKYRDLFQSVALENLNKLDAAMKCYRRFRKQNPVPWFLATYAMK
ncbi:MAG TPA: tetratricopeptide repeat protein, partial [Acidobacteriota bacterium]|nr:tetratricopeptide repeat protein [Acidobacteriota bacterium]